jgi:hypothetical protein
MMLSFSGQDVGMRFWAILSCMILAVLGVLAGVILLLTEHQTAGFDMEMPNLFRTVSFLGTWSLALAWLIYIATLAIVLGYRRTDRGDVILFVTFLLVGFYFLTVLSASIQPWLVCRMTMM